VTIGDCAPHHLAEQTLPLLFGYLPDRAPLREATSERERCWLTLSALRSLCVLPELFENMVIRLISKLDLISFPSPEQLPVVSADLEPTAAYAHMILKTLAQTLTIKVKKKHVDVPKNIDRLVPSLFNIFISSAFLSDEREMIAIEPRLIQVAGDIITLVVQTLPLQ
jgi:DNA repair/transcription protein MET18/MMS19